MIRVYKNVSFLMDLHILWIGLREGQNNMIYTRNLNSLVAKVKDESTSLLMFWNIIFVFIKSMSERCIDLCQLLCMWGLTLPLTWVYSPYIMWIEKVWAALGVCATLPENTWIQVKKKSVFNTAVCSTRV